MMKSLAILVCGLSLLSTARAQSTLETVFEDPEYQFTGVAISKSKRLFLNYPRWTPAHHRYDVVEVLGDGGIVPYPDEASNAWKPGDDAKMKWVCVQSVYVDDRDFLWVVDAASPEFAGVIGGGNKLVKINLKTDSVVRNYDLSSVAGPKSYLNDVRVDTERQVAYLTNSNEGGIIVLDLKTGVARQVLQGAPSVKADPDYTFKVNGVPLRAGGKPVKIQSDGLALTPDGEWLYYKPLTDPHWYRIATALLRNKTLTTTQLNNRVQTLGHLGTTDGMICNRDGNLFFGDIEKNALVCMMPNLKTVVIARDPRLSWPDSYAISDGWLYVTCTQIQNMPRFNEGKDLRKTPYTLYRLKIPAVR